MSASKTEWEKVKNNLEESLEFKRFCEKISYIVREDLDSTGNESLATLVEERIRQALSLNEVVYTSLQEKVTHSIDLHFSSAKKDKKDVVLRALADMLLENPSLGKMLTVFINTSLPLPLRKALWGVILRDQVSRDKFLIAYEGEDRRMLLDPELLERCTSILEGKPMAEFSRYKQLAFEYCAILNFWKDKSKAELTTTNCLLCLPFLYLFKDELRSSSKEVNWQVVAIAAEMFTSYMRILPLNMRNIRQNSQALKALQILCQEVESELDPVLVNHLSELFASRGRKYATEPFHSNLSILIHDFLQRIFIGILSIDVVSFIIDQSFIILGVPNCSFMHFFVASWLHLLQKKLINCQSVEKVSETLAKQSLSLTVSDFQAVIKEKYFAKIMSKVTAMKHNKQRVERKERFHKSSRASALSYESERSVLQPLIQRHRRIEDQIYDEKTAIELEKLKYDKSISKLQAELDSIKKALKLRASATTLRPSTITEVPELPSPLPPLPLVTNERAVTIDPNCVTESDVINVWLQIMKRFTAAKYLICHGTDEEKLKLKNI